jgi:hypothetical protein
MHTDTEYLNNLAEEIAAASKNAVIQASADHRLVLEAKRLEKAITLHLRTIDNFTQRDTFHFDILSKLVTVCDTLFLITNDINPNARVLVDLLTAIRQVLPSEIKPNLKLPKAFIALQLPVVLANQNKHLAQFKQYGVCYGDVDHLIPGQTDQAIS